MFIATDLETFLGYINRLTPETQPKWGTMHPQRMVEHLTDTLRIATGKNPIPLQIPEDKMEGMQAYLASDKPMPENFSAAFIDPEMKDRLRNEEMELAIDELVEEWLQFEELFEKNPQYTVSHPYYGPLNYEQWIRLNQKHHTHHLKQFGLLD